MSKHSSLKATGTVGGKRSVLKRFERVKLLKERGEWKKGQSPLGLPTPKHAAYASLYPLRSLSRRSLHGHSFS